ncbi:MAG: tetratricopeptide repeat protein [Spirochaetaceae bacterium]|jgi:tetratricopeptide (TPR) repeat protein|nr:tetratricopeptide repeat protein [Spirochaetaceae bacterium]
MKTRSVLNQAICAARSGKHSKAVGLLVPQIYNYRDNWIFYYTLALASLYVGDAGAAREYSKSAYDISNAQTQVLLLLAALNIKRSETGRAIQYYLRILETDAGNKIALRGLAILKKHGGSERLNEWIESGKIKTLYPPYPPVPAKRSAVIPVIAFAVIGCGAFVAWKTGITARWTQGPQKMRAGFVESAMEQNGKEKLIDMEGAWEYVLTEKEVRHYYEKARTLFNEQRDDAARVEINRILNSNASESIKNKMRQLDGLLENSAFNTLRDRFSSAQVAGNPSLYRNCTVLWRGMAANITNEGSRTSFDLLVGYDTRARLEATVPVSFTKAVEVSAETPLEVLGSVVPTQSPPGYALNGIAIHQSILPQ